MTQTHSIDISTLLQQGVQYHKEGDLNQAEQAYRTVLSYQPNNTQAAHYLGLIARECGKLEIARQFFEQALQHSEQDAVLHYNLALTLQQLGQAINAIQHYRQAIKIRADFPQAYNNLGVLLNESGEHQAAVTIFKQALQLDPDRPESYYNLAYAKKFDSESKEIAAMQRLLANGKITQQDNIKLNFALGKIHDDLSQYDKAFDYYQAGNQLTSADFDGQTFTVFIDRLIEIFSADFFEQRKNHGIASHSPLFIVGMPRSGTTLLEQILSSHPEIHGAGELDYMTQIFTAMPQITGSSRPLPECLADITASTSKTLAQDYLQQLQRHSNGAVKIIDKTPLNFLQLGLIALLFPNARVIHSTRDPRDTCLSCYFQNFSREHAFSYDLENLGVFYRQYQRLMHHWQDCLPLELYEIAYEDLIHSPETEAKKLVTFCQLEWSERCLEHHENSKNIKTASLYQARQPIYQHAINRWKHYQAHLTPLEAVLNS